MEIRAETPANQSLSMVFQVTIYLMAGAAIAFQILKRRQDHKIAKAEAGLIPSDNRFALDTSTRASLPSLSSLHPVTFPFFTSWPSPSSTFPCPVFAVLLLPPQLEPACPVGREYLMYLLTGWADGTGGMDFQGQKG